MCLYILGVYNQFYLTLPIYIFCWMDSMGHYIGWLSYMANAKNFYFILGDQFAMAWTFDTQKNYISSQNFVKLFDPW